MARRSKFSIQLRLFLVITGVFLSIFGAYALSAARFFHDGQIDLFRSTATVAVKAIAGESKMLFSSVAEQGRRIAQAEGGASTAISGDSPLVAIAVYEATAESGHWNLIRSIVNENLLRFYHFTTEELEQWRSQLALPFAKALTRGTLVLNSTLPSGVPLVTLAFAFGSGTPKVVVIEMKMDELLAPLLKSAPLSAFLVDYEGRVIAHPDSSLVMSRALLTDIPVVRDAISAKSGDDSVRFKRFEWNADRWLAVSVPVGFGDSWAMIQVKENQIYNAAFRLLRRSFVFAFILISVAAGLVAWLSRLGRSAFLR